MELDLSFLDINRLVYAYKNTHDESLALEALELMDKFQCLHKAHESILDDLSNHPKFNKKWAAAVFTTQEERIKTLNDSITSTELLEATELSDFDNYVIVSLSIRDLFLTYTVNGNYLANNCMIQLSLQIQGPAQPNTIEDLASFKYVELIFFQYAARMQALWFYGAFGGPSESFGHITGNWWLNQNEKDLDDALADIEGTSSGRIDKAPPKDSKQVLPDDGQMATKHTLFRRAQLYFNKNKELFLTQSDENGGPTRELKFYWLISWLGLCHLFRQGDFEGFLNQFFEILLTEPRHGMTPLDVLDSCGYTGLKSEILVQLGFCLALIMPFKSLSILNCREASKFKITLIDMFMANEDSSVEAVFFEFLTASNQTRFADAKRLAEDVLIPMVKNHFGYLIPKQQLTVGGVGISFLVFFTESLDFKAFLMFINSCKRIPTDKMLKFIGYDNPSVEKRNELFKSLMQLMSILELGKVGVGYDEEGDFFYNYGPESSLLGLQEEVDTLSAQMQVQSIASILKANLIDRVFNV